MLYGIPVSLITALAVMGCPIGDKCDKVKEELGYLKDKADLHNLDINKLLPKEEKLREVENRFKHLKEKRVKDEDLTRLLNMNTSSYSLERIMGLLRQYQLKFDLRKINAKKPTEKRKIIFYLFSRSVPARTVNNVFASSRKLKGFEFFGVLRGIDKKTLEYLQNVDSFKKVRIKINPYIFEKVGAGVVPAFVYAECPPGEFRSKLCDYKYVVYGDISLEYAMDKFLSRLEEGK